MCRGGKDLGSSRPLRKTRGLSRVQISGLLEKILKGDPISVEGGSRLFLGTRTSKRGGHSA